MKVIIAKNPEEISLIASSIIEKQIQQNPNSILGFDTENTLEKTYKVLSENYQKNHISWKNIKTFNLDEYTDVEFNQKNSKSAYMNKHLFSKVDIDLKNVNFPSLHKSEKTNINNYQNLIDQTTKMDLLVLGIGTKGQIGFNQANSNEKEIIYQTQLTSEDIKNINQTFNELKNTPKSAITMGLGLILKAKKIILLASGDTKIYALRSAIDNSITNEVPASLLQNHPDVTVIVDEKAGQLLKQFRQTMVCGYEIK